jgi:hypothetical protein
MSTIMSYFHFLWQCHALKSFLVITTIMVMTWRQNSMDENDLEIDDTGEVLHEASLMDYTPDVIQCDSSHGHHPTSNELIEESFSNVLDNELMKKCMQWLRTCLREAVKELVCLFHLWIVLMT